MNFKKEQEDNLLIIILQCCRSLSMSYKLFLFISNSSTSKVLHMERFLIPTPPIGLQKAE